jgi:hypothetical protein
VSDAVIEAGIVLSGVSPDLVSWYASHGHRVTLRVESGIGKSVERWLYPSSTAEDVADRLRGMVSHV